MQEIIRDKDLNIQDFESQVASLTASLEESQEATRRIRAEYAKLGLLMWIYAQNPYLLFLVNCVKHIFVVVESSHDEAGKRITEEFSVSLHAAE